MFSKLRYHKIVIMTDADVDGAHIRTLLLTLFFRHFMPVIDAGHVYIAQPPLYKISRGKESHYAFNDAEKDVILERIKKSKALSAEKSGKKSKKDDSASETSSQEGLSSEALAKEEEIKIGGVNIQRYKGLGEMNPGQLWETTMDPQNRVLKQVTVADAAAADKVFDVLMGDDVAPRKRFIQTHAKKVQNLDI